MTDEIRDEDTLDSQEDVDTSDQHDESDDDGNEELTKAQELARNQKIRAEKAEKELKRLKAQDAQKTDTPTDKVGSGYSLQDIRALSNVHDDDVERVEKFAKLEGVSVAEAVKNEDVQAILKHRADLRQTAEATNTGKTKRGGVELSAEQIVQAAQSGKEVDPVKFAEAELALARAQAQK